MERMFTSEENLQQGIRMLERACLDALVQDIPFVDLGNEMCRRIESIVPGVVASICQVVDHCLRPWAAPNFPPAYGRAFDGVVIGEGVATCGTTAFRGTPVLTSDIESDPAWASYKQHVLKYGCRACWSYPICRRSDGKVVGTFAFYSMNPGLPPEHISRIAESCVYMCLLAFEREERRKELESLVRFDSLTGLHNRRSMNELLGELVASDFGRGLGVFILALGNLNHVNSVCGRGVGDQMLVEVAKRLRGEFGSGPCLGRFSGNDFLVVVKDCDTEQAMVVAERLLEIVGRPVEIDGEVLDFAARVGVSWRGPNDRLSGNELLDMAHIALAQTKMTVGESYQFFSPEMNIQVKARLELEAELRAAVASNHLCLAYQPQVCAKTGGLCGLEALARWRNKRLGEVPPGRFISLAEEIGLIKTISLWALREVCRQLSQWRAWGLAIPAISVNVSPIVFQDPGLVTVMSDLLKEFGLEGKDITIEVTEGTVFELTPAAVKVMLGLRALGVGLSVDDFGTGFANLTNLVNFPITEIKIDQSFVEKCPVESREQTLVEMVIGIGRALGVSVVAEGVETPAQVDWLATANCPVLQGHMISLPLDPECVPDWITTKY